MDGILGILKVFNGDYSQIPSWMTLPNVGIEGTVLLLGLVILATTLVNSICARTSIFNHVVTFLSLLAGAVTAIEVIGDLTIPMVTSDLALLAITANFGMTIAGLVLVVVYRKSVT